MLPLSNHPDLATAPASWTHSIRFAPQFILKNPRRLRTIPTIAGQAKTDAFKAKTAENASKAKRLEQKARIAETKAEAFRAKPESAAAIAEKALEASQ